MGRHPAGTRYANQGSWADVFAAVMVVIGVMGVGLALVDLVTGGGLALRIVWVYPYVVLISGYVWVGRVRLEIRPAAIVVRARWPLVTRSQPREFALPRSARLVLDKRFLIVGGWPAGVWGEKAIASIASEHGLDLEVRPVPALTPGRRLGLLATIPLSIVLAGALLVAADRGGPVGLFANFGFAAMAISSAIVLLAATARRWRVAPGAAAPVTDATNAG